MLLSTYQSVDGSRNKDIPQVESKTQGHRWVPLGDPKGPKPFQMESIYFALS